MAESLLLYLLQSSAAIAVSGGIILFIRNVFYRHLTAEIRYRLWFLLLFLAAAPFLAAAFPGAARLADRLIGLRFPAAGDPGQTGALGTAGNNFTASGILNDFSISVSREIPGFWAAALICLWGGGTVILTVLTLISAIRVNHLKRTSLPVQDDVLRNLYADCIRQLGIRRKIPLRFSPLLHSPVTAGTAAPCVLLPDSQLSGLSENEIRCILLHELHHYKHKDLICGAFFRILLIFYWFHPMVWLALKEMVSDREIACDTAVLSLLGENASVDYGTALLHFAARLSHLTFGQTAGIGGSRKEIRKRISFIASYRRESGGKRIKSRMLYLLTAALVLCTTPSVSALACASDRYTEALPRTDQEDLSEYFGQLDGSFVLYDASENRYLISNEEDARTRVSPNSTYKIYSALMALDAGIITGTDSAMDWNGETYPFESWNRDQNLNSAMANSVNWYFMDLDHRRGWDSTRQVLTSLSYGNMDFSGGPSRFWLESSLKISPLEQVKLLAGLSGHTLPFSDNGMETVQNALFLSSDGTSSLYGKTGTGTVDGKNTNGWFIGFVESVHGPYSFAVHISGEDGATGVKAGEIALDILKAKKLYGGN